MFKEPLPEIWPSAEAEGAATDYASDCMCMLAALVKTIWIFVEMLVFVIIVICEIFHCYEHNLECLDVERSKSLCWQGNFSTSIERKIWLEI